MKLGEHYEVNFHHRPDQEGEVPFTDLKYKGITTCVLHNISDDNTYVGYAWCSVKDQFNRKSGRKVSFSEAISLLESKSIRSELWSEYWRKIHR